MNRHLRLAVPLMLVVAALVFAACSVPEDKHPREIPADQVLFDLLTPSTSSTLTTLPAETVEATIYVISGDRLVPVTRNVAAPATLGTVLATLIQGPNDAEQSEGYRSAVITQTRVVRASVNGGVAQLDLSDAFTGLPPQEQVLALAQLVYTATGVEGVDRVQVLLDSLIVDVPRGDGSVTNQPLSREDYSAFAPANPQG